MVYVSKYDWNDIQSFYDAGNSWQEVTNEFGCVKTSIQKKLQTGVLKGRNRTETYYIRKKQGKIKKRVHLPVTKDKMSKAMKKAHAEGRAHNIGTSRWNNEPSWPEQFFMKVIENEFQIVNPVGLAW